MGIQAINGVKENSSFKVNKVSTKEIGNKTINSDNNNKKYLLLALAAIGSISAASLIIYKRKKINLGEVNPLLGTNNKEIAKKKVTQAIEDKRNVLKEKRLEKIKNTKKFVDKSGNLEIEIKGKGALNSYNGVNELHCMYIDHSGEKCALDATKPMLVDGIGPCAETISYTRGNQKYTVNFLNDSQSLKVKTDKGKFKTIKRETADKIVWHKPDGTTEVLDKSSNFIKVYDKKGNVIDELGRYSKERPKVTIPLTNSGNERSTIETANNLANSNISGFDRGALGVDTKTLSEWMDEFMSTALKKGK